MQCRHTVCHQCEDAGLVSLREEYEIVREDNEKLRALLAEAREEWLRIHENCAHGVALDTALLDRIDAALAG